MRDITATTYYLLHTLDLTPLAAVLQLHLDCPPALAPRILLEYRRFLALKAATQHATPPTAVWCPRALRIVWQAHVLDTRAYWDMCEAIGVWIQHVPFDDTDGGRSDEMDVDGCPSDRIESTLASYKAIFNTDPPADIWLPVESAGDAYVGVSESLAALHLDETEAEHTTAAIPIPHSPNSSPRISLTLYPVASYTDPSTGHTHLSDLFDRPARFLIKPSSQFSRLVARYAEYARRSVSELVFVKTGVVGPDGEEARQRAITVQGGMCFRVCGPQWGDRSVEQAGFVDHEHVLCVGRESDISLQTSCRLVAGRMRHVACRIGND